MSVARFIADQRTLLPSATHPDLRPARGQVSWSTSGSAELLVRVRSPGCTPPGTGAATRVDRAAKVAFDKARGLHGSPRLLHDLRDDGWRVSEKTVADSMRRQGRWHAGPAPQRADRQDKTAPKSPTCSNATSARRDQRALGGRHTENPTADQENWTWPP